MPGRFRQIRSQETKIYPRKQYYFYKQKKSREIRKKSKLRNEFFKSESNEIGKGTQSNEIFLYHSSVKIRRTITKTSLKKNVTDSNIYWKAVKLQL